MGGEGVDKKRATKIIKFEQGDELELHLFIISDDRPDAINFSIHNPKWGEREGGSIKL